MFEVPDVELTALPMQLVSSGLRDRERGVKGKGE